MGKSLRIVVVDSPSERSMQKNCKHFALNLTAAFSIFENLLQSDHRLALLPQVPH